MTSDNINGVCRNDNSNVGNETFPIDKARIIQNAHNRVGEAHVKRISICEIS